MTVWDTFFMMLMVIPVSKMLSSIFMKLIARIGTIDEEKYAAMGMGTILAIAAVAGVGKDKVGKIGAAGAAAASLGAGTSSGSYSGPGDGGSGGTGGSAGLGEPGGEDPASPSSATLDFLGVDSGAETSSGSSAGAHTESTSGAGVTAGASAGTGVGSMSTPPIGGAPLDDISKKAGVVGNKAATYGAYTGAVAPVAAPVVAGIMAFTTRAMVGPAVAAHGIGKNLKEGYQGHREGGMGRTDALARSAMDLTGASSSSEASARILGSVLGSSFGGGGARTGSNALGATTKFVNDKSGWIKDKVM